MGLEQKLRDDMHHASGTEKNTLKVIVAEIERFRYGKQNAGKELTDTVIHKIIRKLAEDNDNTMNLLRHNDGAESRINALRIENNLYNTYLPKTISCEEIETVLVSVRELIADATSESKAMGLAMKMMREAKVDPSIYNGDLVKSVVEKIRNSQKDSCNDKKS